MSKKTDAFYFDTFQATAKICVDAAEYLVTCLEHYDAAKIDEWLRVMHEYENNADIQRHKITKSLSKAFITPLEREDLAQLSNELDDVADNIEEVLQLFYLEGLKEVTPACVDFAKKISVCCQALEKMFAELPNFKKPQRLLAAVVEINDTEEECDRMYLEAYKAAKTQFSDPLDIIAWRKIYEYLERCADACEHVADTVDMIVMKNT